MYEGGLTLQGDGYLLGYGGNAQLTEYMMHHARSPEAAEALGLMYQNFLKAGGAIAAKFELDGIIGQYGLWANINYWPSAANGGSIDNVNPSHLVTLLANSGKRRLKIRT